MSWSVSFLGPKSEAAARIAIQFDNCQAMYKPDTLEGCDIVCVRARVEAALEALVMAPMAHFDSEHINVQAHGSHTTYPEGPTSVQATWSVSRVLKT